MPSTDALIKHAAYLLAASRSAVALTGAGISVPSGIPDFRSPGSGLWESSNPMEVASLSGFLENPQQFYDWIRPLAVRTAAARPNAAHHALSRLQALGRLGTIITQNIDGLHEAAGSQNVLAVHGHTRSGTCTTCWAPMDGERLWEAVLEGRLPACPCGGIVKADVILFGEYLPQTLLAAAEVAASQADVLLVVGSSLEVSPVADLPLCTHESGGDIVIVNLGPTQMDRLAAIKIEADVAEALPAIVEQVAELIEH